MGWHAWASDAKLEKVSLMFSSWTLTLSMTLTSGLRRWRKRSNSGRKRKYDGRGEYQKAWSKSHKRISLEERIVLSLWGWMLLRMSTRDSVPLTFESNSQMASKWSWFTSYKSFFFTRPIVYSTKQTFFKYLKSTRNMWNCCCYQTVIKYTT